MRFLKSVITFLLLLSLMIPIYGVSAATALDSPELSYESYTYWQDTKY